MPSRSPTRRCAVLRPTLRVAARSPGRESEQPRVWPPLTESGQPVRVGSRAAVLEAGITTFVPQLVVRTRGPVVRVDLGDPDLRLVLEADSFAFHGSRSALDRDCRRYDELVRARWLVLRFSWEQVMFERDWVAEIVSDTVAWRRLSTGAGNDVCRPTGPASGRSCRSCAVGNAEEMVQGRPLGSSACCCGCPRCSCAPCATTRPTPRSRATGCWCAPGTSAATRRASTPGCPWATASTATSSAWCARRWTPRGSRRCTSRPCCPASPTRPPTGGPSTATTSSGSRTARAPTTCSGPRTRSCSPSR